MKKILTYYSGLFSVVLALSACSDPNQAVVEPDGNSGPLTTSAPGQPVALAHGKIEVRGGLLDIVAQHGGIFTQVNVQEGARVTRGEVLAQLDTEGALLNNASALAELQQAQAQYTLKAGQLPEAKKLADRWQKAAAAGAAEQQRADDALRDYQQLSGELAVSQAAVEVAESRIAQADHALKQRTLRAPQNGEIVKVHVQTGSSIQAGQVAFVLLPEQPLWIRAEIIENFIDRVHVDMEAEVAFDSAPQTPAFKARVTRIGKIFEPSRLGNEAQERSGRSVECMLEVLNNNATPAESAPPAIPSLRIGQNVLVRFYE